MRLVRITSVRDDMELARDIPSGVPGGAPLLRQGVRLSAMLAARLAARNVRAVWIEDDMGDGIIPLEPLPEEVRRATEVAVGSCMNAAKAAVEELTTLPDAAIKMIERAVGDITTALEDCPEAALAFDDLATADSYTYSHSVRVATLGVLLGQRIDRIDGWIDWRGNRRHDRMEERMTQLGVGLLIHDIGKISIPEAILNKPDKLTPAEWELIKTHPLAGASMLSPERVSPLSIAIVRDHHERWDGLGYARGRKSTEIHQFARIATVADVYDAVTADRPYRAGAPPYVGVKVVTEAAGTQFEPSIVEHFLRLAMPYPVGYSLTLPDGSAGVVAGVDPDNPEYPVIRHRDGAQLRELAMHVVDGKVVSGHPDAEGEPAPEDEETDAVELPASQVKPAYRPAA